MYYFPVICLTKYNTHREKYWSRCLKSCNRCSSSVRNSGLRRASWCRANNKHSTSLKRRSLASVSDSVVSGAASSFFSPSGALGGRGISLHRADRSGASCASVVWKCGPEGEEKMCYGFDFMNILLTRWAEYTPWWGHIWAKARRRFNRGLSLAAASLASPSTSPSPFSGADTSSRGISSNRGITLSRKNSTNDLAWTFF